MQCSLFHCYGWLPDLDVSNLLVVEARLVRSVVINSTVERRLCTLLRTLHEDAAEVHVQPLGSRKHCWVQVSAEIRVHHSRVNCVRCHSWVYGYIKGTRTDLLAKQTASYGKYNIPQLACLQYIVLNITRLISLWNIIQTSLRRINFNQDYKNTEFKLSLSENMFEE